MATDFKLDQEIIIAARKGSREAFDQIYRNTQSSVFHYVLKKVHDYELALDLTQDVFLKAFSSIHKVQKELNLLAWLYTIARNTCLDHWRKYKSFSENIPIDELTTAKTIRYTGNSYEKDPHDILKHREIHSLLTEVLASLNTHQRQSLLLKDYEGLSYQDAARTLNISVAAFTSLLNRSRTKFTQLMIHALSPELLANFGYKECLNLLHWFDPLDWPDNLSEQITYKALQYFDDIAHKFSDLLPKRYPSILDDILLARYQPDENAIGGDFGSGFGHLSAKMAGRFHKVHAIDLSPQMVNVAKRHFEIKGLKNIKVNTGDVHMLPLPDECLDIAYCVVVLHHVLDPVACIREMGRVLKKGGKLIVADFGAHKHDHVLDEHKDLWLGFNQSEFAKWFKKANFEGVWAEHYSDINFSIESEQMATARIPLLLAGGIKQ